MIRRHRPGRRRTRHGCRSKYPVHPSPLKTAPGRVETSAGCPHRVSPPQVVPDGAWDVRLIVALSTYVHDPNAGVVKVSGEPRGVDDEIRVGQAIYLCHDQTDQAWPDCSRHSKPHHQPGHSCSLHHRGTLRSRPRRCQDSSPLPKRHRQVEFTHDRADRGVGTTSRFCLTVTSRASSFLVTHSCNHRFAAGGSRRTKAGTLPASRTVCEPTFDRHLLGDRADITETNRDTDR